MAILDIFSFTLIDPELQIEDSGTPVGRVWDCVLQKTLRERGALHVYWGRQNERKDEVMALIVWDSEASRNDYHHTGLGTTALNKFLSEPATLRYTKSEDLDKLSMLDTQWLLISRPDAPEPQGGFWPKGVLHRVEVSETLPEPKDALESGMITITPKLSQDAEYTTAVQLHTVVIGPTETESARRAFTRLSHVFTRCASSFGQPLPREAPEIEIHGPALSWTSPMTSIQYGIDNCFSARTASRPPSELRPELYPSKAGYFETISLSLANSLTELEDKHTQAGVAFMEYKRALLSSCKSLHIVRYPTTPRHVDLLVEWEDSSTSAGWQQSQHATHSRDHLSQHVESISQREGAIFHPRRDAAWAEVIDFELSNSASPAERRALEFYLSDFNQTMQSHDAWTHPPVYAAHEGWIEDIPQEHGKYRVVYHWTGQEEESLWVKQFMERPYVGTGHLAHMVALAADCVVGLQVSLNRERLEDLRDHDDAGGDEVETANDEDMGF